MNTSLDLLCSARFSAAGLIMAMVTWSPTLMAAGDQATDVGSHASKPAHQAKPLKRTGSGTEVTITVKAFEFQGPELISRASLIDALNPFLNKPLRFDELRAATQVAERLHAKAGYEVVRVVIPEQDVQQEGILKLQIIDARLDQIAVAGNKHFSNENVLASLPVLTKGTLLNADLLDKQLRLANDNPAKVAQISLSPSDQSGLVDAKVGVADQEAMRGYVTLDNTGTNATGRYRLGFVGQHANLWNRDHVLTVQALTSPDNHASDVKIVGAYYRIPFYKQSGALELNANYSSVNAGVISGGGIGTFSIAGKGKLVGARWVQTLPRWQAFDQRLSLGVEYKLFESNVLFNNQPGSLVPDVESRPLGLVYSAALRELHNDANLSLGFYQNIAGGGRNNDQRYAQLGRDGDAAFNLLRGSASWLHRYAQGWMVRAEVAGQYSRDALIPGEQFGVGGAYSVRGFLERELAQDRGIRQSLELTTPELCKVADNRYSLRAVVFADAAQIHRNKALANEDVSQSIASVGGGLRLNVSKQHSIRFDVARVTRAGGTQANGDVMVHVSLISQL